MTKSINWNEMLVTNHVDNALILLLGKRHLQGEIHVTKEV